MIKYGFVLLLALLGIIATAYITLGDKAPNVQVSSSLYPSRSPYDTSIAAVGVVEADKGNIVIGSPVSGVVSDIYVKVGDQINQGEPLFKIDDQDLQARMLVATAKHDEAEAALLLPMHRKDYLQRLQQKDPGSISTQEISGLEDEVNLARATRNLTRAEVDAIKLEINRRTVYAPIAGQILQQRMRPGEYIDSGNVNSSLMIIGNTNKLFVRVNIDENEIWRFQPDTNASAFVRGDPEIEIPLTFEYTEPYVSPKKSLTGQPTERTDVRVLQVMYSFNHENLPVYVGQQLDIFIKAGFKQK